LSKFNRTYDQKPFYERRKLTVATRRAAVNGEYVESYCQTAASKKAFVRVQKKMRALWLEK
jgi:hypothetical protein